MQKEPEAIYNLGLMYLLGEGVAINVARGLRMLERAARLGSLDAQQFLGDVFAFGGYEMRPDPERAVYYYLKSLAAGYRAAGYRRSALLLAVALERRGRISRTSLIKALIRVAAEGGVKEAQKR